MSRRRVAVIGLGVGRSHVESWKELPDLFELRAVVDRDAPRAQAIAAEFGVPEAATDMSRILGRSDIDIIDIATPPATHLELAEAGLAAGHHVICEKPLVASLADCDRLTEAASRAKGVLMPIFQYRWGDGIERLRRLIAAGVPGRLFLATVETLWHRSADYYAVPWRGKRATELGGCLTTHAIHAHDMLRNLVGEYRSVFARTATRVNAIEVEDCAAVSCEMADGSLATLSVTLGSVPEISRLRLSFERLTAESCLAPYSPGDDPWTITARDPTAQAEIDAVMAGFRPRVPRFTSRFAGQFEAFHATLEAGAPPPVTVADARASLELLTALYHSAATGQAVSLPLAADHPRYAGW